MAAADPVRRRWVLLSVGTGTFMSALDASIVNTILPVIRASFDVPLPVVQWVITVYLLVVSGLLLTFGRLGDLRGHKRVYATGFGVFILGSLVCALAPTEHWLIGGRVVQATGGAMLYANSPGILTASFPAAQRGKALGLLGSMTYLGLSVGPAAGGFLTDTFGWRSVFYINVPVGLTALWLTFRYVPTEAAPGHGERFDPAGALTFGLGLLALLFALNRGAPWGWASAPVLASFAAALVLLAAFVVIERRVQDPMLDLNLFRVPVFTTTSTSAVLNYVCIYTLVFLVPFYLVDGRGLTPSQAGLVLTAQPIVMAITTPLAGALSDRVGTRAPATAGLLLLGAGIGLLSRMGAHTPLPLVVGALALTGLGTGAFVAPNNSALMGAAPRRHQGVAGGVLALARNTGMALGVAWAGALFTTFQPLLGGGVEGFFPAIRVTLLATAGIALAASFVPAFGLRTRTRASRA